jgi:hypothetical protein
MTARKPEFDWLINGLEQVEEEIRKPIRKLCRSELQLSVTIFY